MKPQNYIIALLIFSLTIAFCNCKISPKLTFMDSTIDSTIKATKISISELADNYKIYQGQFIETTGTFYYEFENVAICTDKSYFTDETKCFWLDIDHELKISSTDLNKMSGKNVTIKGIIDTTSKGHLNTYSATIKRIYFWQLQ